MVNWEIDCTIINGDLIKLNGDTTILNVTIPSGFISDGVTIPRIFSSIYRKFGAYLPAAILHDFLIKKYPVKRKEHLIKFRQALVSIGANKLDCFIMVNSVRIYEIIKGLH